MIVFECEEDGVCPLDVQKAGEEGRLKVSTCIGWIGLDVEDFSGVRNGLRYGYSELGK